ncbi:MAG TPA: hypothetical protein VD767_02740 [Thermomicrobiales bacterium]|nr:hypothetical protein [Thermomicrobiales bacterium]
MDRVVRIARWVCVVLLGLSLAGAPVAPGPVAAQDKTVTIHFVDQYGEPFPDGTLTFDWGRRTEGSPWTIRCVSGYLPVYNSSITTDLLDNMYWYGPCVSGGASDQIGDFENVSTQEMPSELTMVIVVNTPPEPTVVPTTPPSPTPEPTLVPTETPTPPGPTESPTLPPDPTETPSPTLVPTLPNDVLVQQLVAALIAVLTQILASQ